MIQDVRERLCQLGLHVGAEEEQGLTFAVRQAENFLCADLNRAAVPDALYEVAVDMACAAYLRSRAVDLDSGGSGIPGLSLDAAIRRIQEGDTTVEYAIGQGSKTDEEKLDALIAYLWGHGMGLLSRFRRVSF